MLPPFGRCRSMPIAALALLSLAFAAEAAATPLPLGPPSLREQRATTTVAPGVPWTRIPRGGAGPGGGGAARGGPGAGERAAGRSGGPRLVRNGRIDVTSRREGFGPDWKP